MSTFSVRILADEAKMVLANNAAMMTTPIILEICTCNEQEIFNEHIFFRIGIIHSSLSALRHSFENKKFIISQPVEIYLTYSDI